MSIKLSASKFSRELVRRSIERAAGFLQLVGDELSPGSNKVYGTDGSGNKGWKDDPAGLLGTFTPGFTFATPGDLAVSYNGQDGTYRRIGDRVWFSLLVTVTPTFSSASGVLRVTGMPFVFNASAPNPRLLAVVTNGQISFNGRTFLVGLGVAGQSYCQIGAYGSNQAAVGITAAEVTSGNQIAIAISGSYTV